MVRLITSLCVAIVVISFQNLYAGESSCLYAYEKMTTAVERAGNVSHDACRAADHIETALNWLGTCEKECSYSKERMRKLSQYKKDLIRTLTIYVQKCGH